jgi:hypothetical protein
MLDKIITSTMKRETVDDISLVIGFIYCVVDKDQKSVASFYGFHDAVDKAVILANDYPNEAPFSIEKRKKQWFSDRSIRVLLERKEHEKTDVSSKSAL